MAKLENQLLLDDAVFFLITLPLWIIPAVCSVLWWLTKLVWRKLA